MEEMSGITGIHPNEVASVITLGNPSDLEGKIIKCE